jgi:hypothetical protein
MVLAGGYSSLFMAVIDTNESIDGIPQLSHDLGKIVRKN